MAGSAVEIVGDAQPAAIADIAGRILEALGPAAHRLGLAGQDGGKPAASGGRSVSQESAKAGRRAGSPTARQLVRTGTPLVQR